ncbi:hypothetical protein FRC02_009050 [Tulasnella sp. 418]|nr:hypothetical protein FRC02_009050 [Tulasnella sp. 418]
MSLNPASQPFFPTTTMRRESSTGSAGLGFQLDTESFPPDAFPTLSLLSTSPKSQDNPNDSSAGSDNGFIGSASSSGTDHDYDTPQGTGAITPNNQSVTPTTATVLGGIPHHPNGPPLRSMSLSVVPRYSSSPAPAVTRKSSVNSFTTAYDFQPSATHSFASRPSRSPMPSSFQNYSLTSSSPATNNPPPLPPNQAPGSSSSLLNSYHPPPTTPSAPLNGIPILNSQQSHHQQQPSDAISSISPSSSARSSSAHAFEASLNFDSQAKSSPFINDILDRLIRCEYTTRDIHREIGDLTRKVNFLVERAMSSSGSGTNNIAPDPIGTSGINGLHRKDSFSQSPLVRDPPGSGLGSLSLLQNNGSASSLLLPPPGTPNHLRDVTREKDEEIRQLNQKINSLTTSVAQLLAVQTQAHIHNVNSAFSPNVNVGLGGGAGGLGSALNTPNLSGTPDLPQALGPAGGGPVGSRTNPRAPVPVRTWSAGNMMNDPGLGPTVGVSRQDSMPAPGMLRDKRRSIAGGLGRRDSGGVSAAQ